MNHKEDKLSAGWKWIDQVHGETGRAVLRELAEISPELVDYIVGFGYGEVYQQSQLSARSKQMVIVASLVGVGHAPTQLKVHMQAALRSGGGISDLEALLQLILPYLPEENLAVAQAQLSMLKLNRTDSAMVQEISSSDQHRIRLAALFAWGGDGEATHKALKAALEDGMSIDEVKSQILLMLLYAGFPSAMNAMSQLKDALQTWS
jgi:4-carboxymuconolactone decarboxylase